LGNVAGLDIGAMSGAKMTLRGTTMKEAMQLAGRLLTVEGNGSLNWTPLQADPHDALRYRW
jgi:hypothetical protein